MTLPRYPAEASSISGLARAAGDVEPSSRLSFWALAFFLSFLAGFAALETSIRLFYRRPVQAESLIALWR